MQKIIPHLWFDKEAKEAADFYVQAFKDDSSVTSVTVLPGTPSGDTTVVSFTLCGQDFMAISAGPVFTFNPSISFLVYCKSKEEADGLWSTLSEGGSVLMELDAYPFSEKYGWLQDKYGLSWQIMYLPEFTQKITPTLMFAGDVCSKAEEALQFYTSVFKNGSIDDVTRYGENDAPDKPGTVRHASFTLEGQQFAAMDSAREHNFTFNEAVSLIINCDNQAEIDYYWEKLSAVPESEQCGWLKDKYGVSWQVTPVALDEMMRNGTPEQVKRLTETFLAMKKIDLAQLEAASKND